MNRPQRDALLGAAKQLRQRAANSAIPPGGPDDPYDRGYSDGRQYAYTVASDYLESLAAGLSSLPKEKSCECGTAGIALGHRNGCPFKAGT